MHAAAIIKAEAKGDAWLADRIYSGVPAGMFGRKQEICIGFMSGASNVTYWLKQRGIEPTKELVEAILAKAKGANHILAHDEVMDVVRAVRAHKESRRCRDGACPFSAPASQPRSLLKTPRRGRGPGRRSLALSTADCSVPPM